MATRKLARMRIDAPILNKLQSKGITTAADLLKRNSVELCGLLDLGESDLNAIFDVVCSAISPKPKSAWQLFLEEKNPQLSLCPAIPSLRIASGITELVGSAGAGKTQACLQLTAQATIPADKGGPGGGVIFIDTEGTFSPSRLIEIARNRFTDTFQGATAVKALTTAVFVLKETGSDALLKRLNALEETIIERNVKLLVVDSIAAVVRPEDGPLASRHDKLGAIAGQLKHLADLFHIPVVVTNQITAKFGSRATGNAAVGGDSKGDSQAALGVGWAHAVNTRFILANYPTHKAMIVAKSPLFPHGTFPFNITNAGIINRDDIMLDDSAAEYDVTAQKIASHHPQS